MIMKRRILIFSLVLMAVAAYAQHDEQVTVEGKYRPKANKVNKLVLQPETPQPSYVFPSSEVNPKEAKQKFALDLEKISPTAFAAKEDKLVTPTKNFLMAGVGTNVSPMFLYKHNSMLSKSWGLGVGLKHNSSWLGIRHYAPSSYMNNAFDISLSTSAIEGLQLDASLYYKNDMCHYYGVNLDEKPLTDRQIELYCPRRTNNTIGSHIGWAPTSTRIATLNHSGGLDYHYAFDGFGVQEHFAGLNYTLAYCDNFWGDKSHPQKAGVDLGFQYGYFAPGIVSYTENDDPRIAAVDTMDMNRVLFKLTPFFEMSDEFYRLRLGVLMDGATRVGENDRIFAIRPDVRGSLFVLDKKLEFYAGLNGGRKMLTYSEISDENPFVGTLSELRLRNVKLGFEGGVRTNIKEMVDVHLGVRYRHTDNDPLYVQDEKMIGTDLLCNKFDILYDETQLVSVLTNVRVKLRNGFKGDVAFAYNNCQTETEEYAWYKPAFEGKLKLTYDFNDKLAFNTAFLYQGGRYAKVLSDGGYQSEKLKDVFDLSLGADYKVNDQLTAFALLDNVACQKYQLYYNYPVTGIQFFAGVKLKF